MRRVWQRPVEAQEKAERARRDIERSYAPAVAGGIARVRLEQLLAGRSGGGRRGAYGALLAIDRQLALDIRQGTPARGGVAGLARRVVLRLMLPFTLHERNLDRALLDGYASCVPISTANGPSEFAPAPGYAVSRIGWRRWIARDDARRSRRSARCPGSSRDGRCTCVRASTRRACDRCRRALRRGPAGGSCELPPRDGTSRTSRFPTAPVAATGFPAGRCQGSGLVGSERNHELHPRRSRSRIQRHARANVSRCRGFSSANAHGPHRAPRRLAACERSAVADQDRRRGRRATRDARGGRALRRYRPTVIFEHGIGASERYGYGPQDVHDLLCQELDMRIFDLDGQGPYSRQRFIDTFAAPIWNFVAVPG